MGANRAVALNTPKCRPRIERKHVVNRNNLPSVGSLCFTNVSINFHTIKINA